VNKINRQNIVSVRFTGTEIAKLQDLAQKRGISEGLLLRELVRNARIEPKEIITWSIASHVEKPMMQDGTGQGVGA
jgi:hypothetical protein